MNRRRFARTLGCLAAAPTLGATRGRSSVRVVRNGHGPGRDLAVISWRTRDGEDAGEVDLPFTSAPTEDANKGRIGPLAIRIAALGGVPNAFEWDTREWQWWRGYPRVFGPRNDEYTRLVSATGGVRQYGWGVRVWTQYEMDGVETRQDWLFPDFDRDAAIAYDCVITIHNRQNKPLDEYGQFFATYVAWNDRKGHFYWDENGALVNFADRGGKHLDYFVAAAGSECARLGYVPHCARGGGTVKAHWRKPVSVSIAGPRGLHHIQMTEEAVTSAIGMGGRGYAQDYILSPPGLHLPAGSSFRTHVRHVFAVATGETLQTLWDAFAASHRRVYALTT